ncbi:anaerobic ribonucleotide reductase-activating protein [compost metagenome]
MMSLLFETDVLIDGKYIEELRDLTLAFRGSKNQKVIDVKRSLMENKTIELNV